MYERREHVEWVTKRLRGNGGKGREEKEIVVDTELQAI